MQRERQKRRGGHADKQAARATDSRRSVAPYHGPFCSGRQERDRARARKRRSGDGSQSNNSRTRGSHVRRALPVRWMWESCQSRRVAEKMMTERAGESQHSGPSHYRLLIVYTPKRQSSYCTANRFGRFLKLCRPPRHFCVPTFYYLFYLYACPIYIRCLFTTPS